jgi:hypothetical protein
VFFPPVHQVKSVYDFVDVISNFLSAETDSGKTDTDIVSIAGRALSFPPG